MRHAASSWALGFLALTSDSLRISFCREVWTVLEDRADEPVLGFEVLVEGHFGDLAFADDPVDAGREAFGEEEVGGALEDFVFGV